MKEEQFPAKSEPLPEWVKTPDDVCWYKCGLRHYDYCPNHGPCTDYMSRPIEERELRRKVIAGLTIPKCLEDACTVIRKDDCIVLLPKGG